MNKYKNIKIVTQVKQEGWFARLARAMARVKNPVEAGKFLRDILTGQEAIIIARRLQIADLLDENYTYEEIHQALGVSHGTIAKIQVWFNNYDDFFRQIIKKTKYTPKKKSERNDWDHHKRKYPLYYWPQELLKVIIENSSKREKQKLSNVLKQLNDKSQLSKELGKLLK